MRPCLCEKDTCHLCRLYHNNPKYKEYWDKPERPQKAAKNPAPKMAGKRKCGCRGAG